MPNKFAQTASRASWTLFQGLFIVAALLAAFATFMAISGVSPLDPTAGGMLWLLGLNFILIAALAWIVIRRYIAIRGQAAGKGKGRLARRFLLLFGLSAMVPAAIVAIFLGATITRGLDNWFSSQVNTVVEESAAASRENFRALSVGLEEDARLMGTDYDAAASELANESENIEQFLSFQSAFRGFPASYIIDSSGQPISSIVLKEVAAYRPPTAEAFREAQEGSVAQTLYERSGLATALVKLHSADDQYMYVTRVFDPAMLVQMRKAEAALAKFRSAKTRSGRLQTLFLVGYIQIAALVLLLSGRLGLEAASHVTGPIGRLARAAQTVRDGDLSVRLPPPGGHDEVDDLTRSFNGMTEQLDEQRNALIRAREDAEDRHQFIETLLAEVSAGIIRIDGNLEVTLANKSASALLDCTIEPGMILSEVAPDFASYAMDTLTRNAGVDASLDLVRDGAALHFRLKTALDPAGGCVLTFDDTTRMVNAQRQLAWQDVARRIAHEIRNPLTPIQLSTERLRRKYSDQIADDDGVFDRCIDTILRQVSDIGRMVGEFSNFARMPKPTIAPFDLKALLESAAFAQGMVSPEAQFNVQAGSDAHVLSGDERLLGQAFGNLLKNAAQALAAMPEEAEVNGQINITLTHDETGAVVIIEDNGPGFPEEARERLLQPYVTTRDDGVGLGLAIVNRIIMDHGGSISLQNRTDGVHGARVRILLPETETMTVPTRLVETNSRVEEPAYGK